MNPPPPLPVCRLCICIGFIYFRLGDAWKDVFSRAALVFFVTAFLTFMSIAGKLREGGECGSAVLCSPPNHLKGGARQSRARGCAGGGAAAAA